MVVEGVKIKEEKRPIIIPCGELEVCVKVTSVVLKFVKCFGSLE